MISAFQFIPGPLQADIVARSSSDDVTTYLQEWLDFCAQNNREGLLPAGKYQVSGPMWVTRTEVGVFRSNSITGEGGGYTDSTSQSTIVTSDLENPVFIISRGRGVKISSIQFTGQNTAPTSLAFPTFDVNDWLSPGIRNNQFSPNCGIAIDPTLGPAPAVGDRYPGLLADYTAELGGSKIVLIENCSFRQFAVGVMVSPANSVQAEVSLVHQTHIGSCAYGASFGQPQSRASKIDSCDIEFCHTGITTDTHGQQGGTVARVDACQMVRMAYGFTMSDTKGGTQISDCYFEFVRQLGVWGAGFSQIKAPLTLTNCEFRFQNDFEVDGKYDPWIFQASGPVNFIGCWFVDNRLEAKVMNFVADFNNCRYRFIGGGFWGFWSDNTLLSSIGNQNNNAVVSISDGLCKFENVSIMSNLDSSLLNVLDATAAFTFADVLTTGYNIVSDVLSFTADSQPEADKLSLEQVLFWEVGNRAIPSMVVETISGLDVTARLVFDPALYGSTAAWLPADTVRALVNPRVSV